MSGQLGSLLSLGSVPTRELELILYGVGKPPHVFDVCHDVMSPLPSKDPRKGLTKILYLENLYKNFE